MSAGVAGPKSQTQQEKRAAYAFIVGPIRSAAKQGLGCRPGQCQACATARLAKRIIKLVDAGIEKLV